jgi:hypothetical protein
MIREDRYLVIKKSDLQTLENEGMSSEIVNDVYYVLSCLPERHYVVVEHDWPEYETVWKMIEQRVDAA